MQDLNDLRYFAAVVSNGGFSAAARALGLPKSRLSRRIGALEEQLGVRLIERSTRHFAITGVGQEIYAHARAALAEAESIEEVVGRLKAEPQGLVRMSCPPGMDTILATELPHLLARFPRLRVQVIVTSRRIDLIEEGIDIAVRVRDRLDTDADLQVRIIGHGNAFLVAGPEFLKVHGAPETPAHIPSFPTLGHTERMGLDRWTLIDGQGREEFVSHTPRLSSSQFEILSEAAIAGIGIALLPETVVSASLEGGRLTRIMPEWSAPEGIVHLVFASRRGLLPSVRVLLDFLPKVLGPIAKTR